MIYRFRRGNTLLKVDDKKFTENHDGTKTFEIEYSHTMHGLEHVYFKRAYDLNHLIKELECDFFKREV